MTSPPNDVRTTVDELSRSGEAMLVTFLSERERPCPRCQYNLRGLTTARCPECGDELMLTVGLVQPRQGAWITTLVATALGAGMGLFFLMALLMGPGSIGAPPLVLITILYFIGMIPMVALVLFMRTAFMKSPRPTQRLIATIAVAGNITAFVLFLAAVG